MDNMQRQMDMFEEGGLRDEGGMVDEESGNEVPIGSTRKEVRDDIPAQVSEGEFVFPADVVRYLGLEKLMEMRQAAKMGLKQMEAMGQMGNSDEATMPDDMPFGMADLVVIGGPDKEPQEKAEGGLFLQSGGSIRMPDFDSSNQDIRIYVKEGSPDRRIPFFDGEPVIPIPAGYVLKGSAPVKTETEEAIPTGGSSDDDPIVPQKTPFQEAGGWDMEFGDPPDAAKVDLWIKEAEKTTGNAPMVMTGVAALFGVLPAALVHGANKWNASSRDANLERALKAARQTTTKGQVDALTKIKTDAAKGPDKGLLGKAIDGVKNLLGISEEETNTVTETASNAGNSTPNPNKDAFSYTQTGRQDIDTAPLTGAKPSLEESKESKEFGKIMGDAVSAEGYTGQGLSDGALEDADVRTMQGDDADDVADKEEFTKIKREADTFAISDDIPRASDGFLEDMDVRTMQGDDADDVALEVFVPTSTIEENIQELGLDIVKVNDNESVRRQRGIDSVGNITGAILGESSIDYPSNIRKQMGYLDKDRMPMDSITGYERLLQDIYEGTMPVEVALSKVNPDAANTIFSELQNLSNEFTETTSAKDITSLNPDVQAQMKDALSVAEAARLSDGKVNIKDIVAGSGVDPIVTSTSSSDDNSGPSLRQQMEQTKKAGEAAQKSLDKYKESDKAKKIAQTGSQEQIKALERTSDVVRDMQRGVQRGFKKGGLASRRK